MTPTMSPPAAGTQTVASSSTCALSIMKRLRGEMSSHPLRTAISSTNPIAASDASVPATMPSTAIDTIRATASTPVYINGRTRPHTPYIFHPARCAGRARRERVEEKL